MCLRNSLLISSRLNFSSRDSSFRSTLSSGGRLSFWSFLRSAPSPSRVSYLLFLLLYLSFGSGPKRLRPEEASVGRLSRSLEFPVAAVRLLFPAGVFLCGGDRALFLTAAESSARLLRHELD